MNEELRQKRRNFVAGYAASAVRSGRLTPDAAIKEAVEDWYRHQEAEQIIKDRLRVLLDKMDREDDSCPSCSAEPEGIHADWCSVPVPPRP